MKLYLESSIPSLLLATDAPEKQALTQQFFERILSGRYEAIFSELFLLEARRTTDPELRARLEEIPDRYGLPVFPVPTGTQKLVDAYVAEKAFTAENLFDASHVAVAAFYRCDVVLSWNFQHIVRPWTIQRVERVHRRLGLQPLVICTPEEVVKGEQ